MVLPAWIEHMLLEQSFVALHEQLFVVNPKANICFTNECLTWRTNARTLWTCPNNSRLVNDGGADMVKLDAAADFPDAVLAIVKAVGLTSHQRCTATSPLQRMGYLKRDPTAAPSRCASTPRRVWPSSAGPFATSR
jgi:hypothetical protein